MRKTFKYRGQTVSVLEFEIGKCEWEWFLDSQNAIATSLKTYTRRRDAVRGAKRFLDSIAKG
jgi:hypothetical protein